MTTYKYFKPDNNLRAEHGAALIVGNGDTAEVSKMSLTQRHLCRQMGLPSGHTRFIAEIGSDGSDDWMEVSDNLYPAFSPYLSASELASVVSVKPAGYTPSSDNIAFQPYPDKINVHLRGDSISAGLGTTSGDLVDVFVGQAMDSIQAQTWKSATPTRYGFSKDYATFSTSLGESTWGNANAGGGIAVYPQREDLAYAQRIKTLPLNAPNNIFIYWLGTNDLAYDATQTGATVWARAAIRIAALRAEFPLLKIIVCSLIRRDESNVETPGTQNYNAAQYNTLCAANYLSAGADIFLDLDGATSELNTATGNTTLSGFYTDGTHITTVSHALLMPATKAAILAAAAL